MWHSPTDDDLFNLVYSHLRMERLVKTEEKKIRKALENAKKRSALWSKHVPNPLVSNDGLISPMDAQQYLKQCLEPVENGLIEMAQRFSPVQWLWYLRRFPNIHHIEDHSFEGYGRTLATILSARSRRKDNSERFDTLLRFPLNLSIANYVLAFMAGSYDLADLHIKYGAAGREIPFRIRSEHLPDPILTKSKRKAGKIFDARQKTGSYGLMGTIPGKIEPLEKLPIFVVDEVYYPEARSLPYFDFRDLETPLIIPTYYIPRRMPLKHISDLYNLTNNSDGQWLSREAFSLLLLAGLLLPIAVSTPEHSINIAMYGYSVHERGDFVLDHWSRFDELVSVIKKLFPGAELPHTPAHLLNDLERVDARTHPILPSVILSNEAWVIVDHANVQVRLEKLLRFPNLTGEIGRKRGFHFEDALQSYIDDSPWMPSNELRAIRQVPLIRSGESKHSLITDIDAIGESGNTLLIVSCKAIIFSVGQDIGEPKALEMTRLRLDEAVLKWQTVKTELQGSPIGENYNFSRYSKIIAVVCTPNVVYTESKLSLSYEIGNLRKASTASEFIEWLHT